MTAGRRGLCIQMLEHRNTGIERSFPKSDTVTKNTRQAAVVLVIDGVVGRVRRIKDEQENSSIS